MKRLVVSFVESCRDDRIIAGGSQHFQTIPRNAS